MTKAILLTEGYRASMLKGILLLFHTNQKKRAKRLLPSNAFVTLSKATGRLSGMGRVEFLLAASRAGVPVVDLSRDEVDEEFA
ncbi:MAG: UPF0175 family protein [Magnetococcus sp. MYC-9]